MRRSILILLLLTGHFSTGSALYAVQPGQSMPDRNLLTLDGSNRLHLADLKGYVVYVDFWASWCTPCRLSLPDLEKLYRRYYGDGFRVIAITVDEHTEDAEAFLALHRVTYPVCQDPAAEAARAFQVESMPTAFLIDRDGTVVMRHQGYRAGDASRVEEAVRRALTMKPEGPTSLESRD